ncbi:MAG: hypothetical protein ACI9AT_000523 [Ulvibacter sp.]|jgi:hypothetical protein
MKTIIHFILATVLISCSIIVSAQDEFPEDPTFYFPEDTHSPNSDFLAQWEGEYAFGSDNFHNDNNVVTLHSYSMVGENFYNKQLATIRADAIKKFLIQKGVQESRVKYIAYGETIMEGEENTYFNQPEIHRTVVIIFDPIQPQVTVGSTLQNSQNSFPEDQSNTESQVIEMEEMVINSSGTSSQSWCDVRTSIADVATQEYNYWDDGNGNRLKENSPNAVPILVEYYSQIANPNQTALPNYQRLNANSIAQKASENKVAWSAATICYILRMAGINESHGFEFSRRHLTYIVKAAHNRTRQENLFWLFDVDEPEAQLKIGDIVCMNRKNKAGNLTDYTFDKLLNRFPLTSSLENVKGVSHCDIVVNITTRNGKQFAQLIGGNKTSSGSGGRGVTVNLIEVELDNDGKIRNPGRDKIFGVIKLMECNNAF